MSILKKFLTIFVVLINFISSSHSQDQIVYLDLDNVVNNTIAGKLIISKLKST